MGFDFGQLGQMGGQIDQVLSTLPYPIDKQDLVQRAREIGIKGRSSMSKAELVSALRNH